MWVGGSANIGGGGAIYPPPPPHTHTVSLSKGLEAGTLQFARANCFGGGKCPFHRILDKWATRFAEQGHIQPPWVSVYVAGG